MPNPIRFSEATFQVTVDTARVEGSFGTAHDITIKPDAEITKLRDAGEKRFHADLDVKGYDFSFKVRKTDHVWWTTWQKFETAERQGKELPVVSIAITGRYRGASNQLRTITLHGGLVFKIDEDSVGSDGSYQEVSISGSCAEASGT